jgi:signal transduction histidine kinase
MHPAPKPPPSGPLHHHEDHDEAVSTVAAEDPDRNEAAEDEHMLQAKLAHELRTPLSAVIAYAEILKNEHFGSLENPRYREYAINIYESARHALSVVDRLLRGQANRPDAPGLTFANLDPLVIVESCLAVVRPLAERAGLHLAVSYAAHLPRVFADELSLKQILLNLLSNAIKFAHWGDRVTVAVDYCDDVLEISVVDTGPGMNAACKMVNAGLGLGLPLAKALAQANGAALSLESSLGEGTRATISFGKDRLVAV